MPIPILNRDPQGDRLLTSKWVSVAILRFDSRIAEGQINGSAYGLQIRHSSDIFYRLLIYRVQNEI